MPEHDLTVEGDTVLTNKISASLDDETLSALRVALDDAGACHRMLGCPAIQRAGFDLAGTDRCRVVGEGVEVARVIGQK